MDTDRAAEYNAMRRDRPRREEEIEALAAEVRKLREHHLTASIDALTELRESLPVGHKELPGVIRAIEVLRTEKA